MRIDNGDGSALFLHGMDFRPQPFLDSSWLFFAAFVISVGMFIYYKKVYRTLSLTYGGDHLSGLLVRLQGLGKNEKG